MYKILNLLYFKKEILVFLIIFLSYLQALEFGLKNFKDKKNNLFKTNTSLQSNNQFYINSSNKKLSQEKSVLIKKKLWFASHQKKNVFRKINKILFLGMNLNRHMDFSSVNKVIYPNLSFVSKDILEGLNSYSNTARKIQIILKKNKSPLYQLDKFYFEENLIFKKNLSISKIASILQSNNFSYGVYFDLRQSLWSQSLVGYVYIFSKKKLLASKKIQGISYYIIRDQNSPYIYKGENELFEIKFSNNSFKDEIKKLYYDIGLSLGNELNKILIFNTIKKPFAYDELLKKREKAKSFF